MRTPNASRKRVLFLCTGNSARSQIAEALLRHIAPEQFDTFSAGITPRTEVHPGALDVLRRNKISHDKLRPKDVATFRGQRFDYVITLCDRAREVCPTFDFAETMHWTFADPTESPDGDAGRRAFDDLFAGLSTRARFLIIVDEKA
jgi:ArsR family transcriptional regulator, arsenate/arsenite/antimonite-responsive transcriptional repressor / arsenate reductase (thioredoxin)